MNLTIFTIKTNFRSALTGTLSHQIFCSAPAGFFNCNSQALLYRSTVELMTSLKMSVSPLTGFTVVPLSVSNKLHYLHSLTKVFIIMLLLLTEVFIIIIIIILLFYFLTYIKFECLEVLDRFLFVGLSHCIYCIICIYCVILLFTYVIKKFYWSEFFEHRPILLMS